jgi:hypothetical protein
MEQREMEREAGVEAADEKTDVVFPFRWWPGIGSQ